MKFLKRLTLLISVIILFIGCIYLIYILNINYDIGLVCTLNKITGLYCSGCGMTRAIFSILKLDFYQAFRYNAFSILLLPILLGYFLVYIYSWLFNKPNIIIKKIPQVFWIVIVIVLLIYGVIRNLPYFSYMAPTVIR